MQRDLLIILPFIVLLLSISVVPILYNKFWHKYYPIIALSLASIVLFYYVFIDYNPGKLLHTFKEYFSFISLLFSLFVVTGSIFIKIKGEGSPFSNILLLMTGAISANIFGTTGASVLLIRPMMEMNSHRLKPYHIIFFIFIISNTGGLLTPIGDPPLLIGYLKGVPFFWTLIHNFIPWFVINAYLITLFYFIDRYYYKFSESPVYHEKWEHSGKIIIQGKYNLIALLVIVASVFLSEPFFLRESIMIAAAILSYKMTSKDIHRKNSFNFEPIKEVAILFAGIFITMIPALDYLSKNSQNLGFSSMSRIYWIAGFLTSFLDNAPTYLNFLSGAMGLSNLSVNSAVDVRYFASTNPVFLGIISVASVIFGAMTYIGNAPNFMVKSIAEHKGIKMPSFFHYIIRYSVPLLLPFYFILWLIFFNR